MTEGEEALVGKWVEFLGERTLPFNPPSWALGSSWPEALAQEYHRPPGLVQIGVALLITASALGVHLRTCPFSGLFGLPTTF